MQKDDWRLQGQEEYLRGKTLIFEKYKPYNSKWEHDHCEFCGAKFSLNEKDLKEGYTTFDNYRWICKRCFSDFKEKFEWTIKS